MAETSTLRRSREREMGTQPAQHLSSSMSQLGQNRKSSMRAHVFRCSPNSGHRQDTSACPFRAISRLPFSENRRIADDKNVNGSRTWLAGCRAKVVTRKQVLYRRTPTRLTPPFKLPPAL